MGHAGLTPARAFAKVCLASATLVFLASSAASALGSSPLEAASPLRVADGTDFVRRAASATQTSLRQVHRYDPTFRQRALEEESAPDAGVIRMAPFEISESKNQVRFERYVTEKRRRDAANRPSLANGGTLPGLPHIGITRYEEVAPPFGPALARWNILIIRR